MAGVAEYLQRLGWAEPEIQKILAGPESSSIHDLAGVKLKVTVVPDVEAVALPDLATVNSGSAE